MTISTVDGLLAAMANPAKRQIAQINKASVATQGAAGWTDATTSCFAP